MTDRDRRADALEESWVLVRLDPPRLEWVEVDGEVVAWSAEEDVLHRLDRPAALVFQLCDGSGTLSRTVADLAHVFGQSPESLREDVLQCAATLLRAGLVEEAR